MDRKSFDTRSEEFFDAESLRTEMLRVVEVCHDCRRCLEFCPLFPSLFDKIDNSHGGWISGLSDKEFHTLTDHCSHCRLCFVECPYTTEREHPHRIDFPLLTLRAKIVRAQEEGIPLRERLLSNPDLIGAAGVLFAPVSNWLNRAFVTRRLIEGLLGIDRECAVPRFPRTTFDRWFRKREKRIRKRVEGTGGRAAIFYSCPVNFCYLDIGKSAVALLVHHDVDLVVPEQRCCGMGYLHAGDLESALQNLEFNTRSMLRHAESGYAVVALQPACSYMMKSEYPWLDDGTAARSVSEATVDLSEYLISLHEQGRLDTKLAAGDRRIFHITSTHMRAQGKKSRYRELLELIPGVEIETLESRSGMETAWAMKKGHHGLSGAAAGRLIEAVVRFRPDRVVSDSSLDGLLVEQGTGLRVSHPVEILCEAYGLSHDF